MQTMAGKHMTLRWLLMLLLLSVACPWSLAMAESSTAGPEVSNDAFATLVGKWVRPDGGYVITIKSMEAKGKLDAMYANPDSLPFSKAQASRDGEQIKLFFEIVAGGYNGSTYTLVYDPASDVLQGIYYQAVARQNYEVQFLRIK